MSSIIFCIPSLNVSIISLFVPSDNVISVLGSTVISIFALKKQGVLLSEIITLTSLSILVPGNSAVLLTKDALFASEFSNLMIILPPIVMVASAPF